MPEALNRKLLCPFQYFGITDSIDLSHVGWEKGRYVASELTNLYTANDRRIGEIINNLDNGYACYILGIDSNVTKSLDVLKMIRDFHLEPNIIMININDEIDASFIKKVYDHGCDEFLKKPFFLDELVIKIEKLCFKKFF